MAQDAAATAEAFVEGGEADLETVARLAQELRESGAHGAIAPLLIAAARRALSPDHDWEPERRTDLAFVLRDHQQFGYARRLLGRVRAAGPDSETLRQQHALCTYKDMELPAGRRLDWALRILEAGGPIATSTDAETLGIAGAIFKRRWEVDVKRADLESARSCYQRGYRQEDDPSRDYAGINAAFVADRLADLEERGIGAGGRAAELRGEADRIREEIAARVSGGDGGWGDATLGEALFGLGRLAPAHECLRRVRETTAEAWRLESTAMQLAELGRLRGLDPAEVAATLDALLGERGGAVGRADNGKVGLALSGGGFRASLFHLGVLARLAECAVLRHVEVMSCVSGGSIVGAFYYLKLRVLLQDKRDGEITDADYVTLVAEVIDEFLDGVRLNLRGQLAKDVGDNWRMLASDYSRSDRVAELLEEIFFAKVARDADAEPGPWHMNDLFVQPDGSDGGFSLRYDNWLRRAKVPMLVLNATSLNTGHSWQFTASWMGEPPFTAAEGVDASRRLRRVYYRDAPAAHRDLPMAKAVAASACIPGLFPPVTLAKLYEGDGGPGDEIDVELVDGGVHDNQGIASLLEQDCKVVLVSDASGQMRDDEDPARGILGVAKRSNSILMGRVRGAQFDDLAGRLRSGVLRGTMVVHLKKGLPAPPRDWSECQEPYTASDDAAAAVGGYGFDPEVQRALAELRTDLDLFSDEEAYALMAAGYAMAKAELGGALSELGSADPELERTWPFGPMLERLAQPGDLADTLRPGNARFFRRYLAWRQRRRSRPPGPVRKLLDATRVNAVPGAAASVVRAGVVRPARIVLSAPLAALGGLGTRLYLRVGRRRGGG